MNNYLSKALYAFDDMSVEEWLKLDDAHKIEKIWKLANDSRKTSVGK